MPQLEKTTIPRMLHMQQRRKEGPTMTQQNQYYCKSQKDGRIHIAVLNHLLTHPEGARPRDLKKIASCTHGTLYNALNRLLERGDIVKVQGFKMKFNEGICMRGIRVKYEAGRDPVYYRLAS